MRVAIAGAGAVGKSIATELLENGHEVLLITRTPGPSRWTACRGRNGCCADALRDHLAGDAGLERCNVVICATGDDKVNLVVSLLAKTEYGVPRVVARVNHPEERVAVQRVLGHRRRGVHRPGCCPRSSRRRSASATWSG